MSPRITFSTILSSLAAYRKAMSAGDAFEAEMHIQRLNSIVDGCETAMAVQQRICLGTHAWRNDFNGIFIDICFGNSVSNHYGQTRKVPLAAYGRLYITS